MPDITMCYGGRCRLRLLCFRHRCIPSPLQSWFAEPPFSEDGTCNRFVELSPHVKEVRTIEECNEAVRRQSGA